MRGKSESQETMLSLRTPAQCVPANHPLRAIKPLADEALAALSKGNRPATDLLSYAACAFAHCAGSNSSSFFAG